MAAISFDVLLEGLLNQTNAIRKQAEAVYMDGISTPAGAASVRKGPCCTRLHVARRPCRVFPFPHCFALRTHSPQRASHFSPAVVGEPPGRAQHAFSA